jgi:hypothetical protein
MEKKNEGTQTIEVQIIDINNIKEKEENNCKINRTSFSNDDYFVNTEKEKKIDNKRYNDKNIINNVNNIENNSINKIQNLKIYNKKNIILKKKNNKIKNKKNKNKKNKKN